MHYDHIVFISLDNLRSDVLGASPHRLWAREYPGLQPAATPVLDELASRAAFLSNTITPAPYTSASHASYFTGLYPLRHGLYEFYGGHLDAPTVFSYGRMRGMRTVMKVDFPIILGPELGFTRDIDQYMVEDDQRFIDTVVEADSSVSFAHFGGIHVPYGFHKLQFGGDHYRQAVERLEAELPPDLPLHVDELTETPRASEDLHLFLRYKRAVHHLYETQQYTRLFDLYLRGLEFFLRERFAPFLDQLLGRLEKRGKRPLVVVFGDHGHTFSRDSFGNFNSLDEGVLRVPVLVYGEGVVPGTHTDRVRTIDVLPTVLDLAGWPTLPDHPPDGATLAPWLRGEGPAPGDRVAFSQAYTADANEFVAYQKRQLAGQAPEPLRHVMLGEVVYLGQRRVLRRYHRYSETFEQILPISPAPAVERLQDGLPQPDPDHHPLQELDLLDAYNRHRRPPRPVVANDQVRDGLRGMGYHV
jgi:choline-sulfatase